MADWIYSSFHDTVLDLSLPKPTRILTVKQEHPSPSYCHHGVIATQYMQPSPPLVPFGTTMLDIQRSPSFYSPPATDCATYHSKQGIKRRKSETYETSSTSPNSRSSSPQRKRKELKVTRPFKAYISNPLASVHLPTSDCTLDEDSSQRYTEFRNRYLEQIKEANGGEITVSNANMRRNVNRSNSTTAGADSAYLEKRMKNNAAAKKSRDRRRMKEDEMAIRIAFLENENLRLTMELAERNKHFASYSIGLQAYHK